MDRVLLSLVLAVLLVVLGAIGFAPVHALPIEPTIAVDSTGVSACADHQGESQVSACSPCSAICASAMAAILPSGFSSMERDPELISLARNLEFSDRRTPPAKSPPRA